MTTFTSFAFKPGKATVTSASLTLVDPSFNIVTESTGSATGCSKKK